REVVDEKNIYRAGGDEFTIILLGVTAEEIDAKIDAIRKASENYDKVSLSLGGCVVDDSRNVREALRKADEYMYDDKEKYYQEHPDKKYEAVMSRR
ncbi:MAG: diguanylate cyclase, partial [Eubacterium sp.]|nr:diguanylate cyclase [Eubacterium sp.]